MRRPRNLFDPTFRVGQSHSKFKSASARLKSSTGSKLNKQNQEEFDLLSNSSLSRSKAKYRRWKKRQDEAKEIIAQEAIDNDILDAIDENREDE